MGTLVLDEQGAYLVYLTAYVGSAIDMKKVNPEEAPYLVAFALGTTDRRRDAPPRTLRAVATAVRDMLNEDGAGHGRITKEQAQAATRAALGKVDEHFGAAPEVLFENVAHVIETTINGGE